MQIFQRFLTTFYVCFRKLNEIFCMFLFIYLFRHESQKCFLLSFSHRQTTKQQENSFSSILVYNIEIYILLLLLDQYIAIERWNKVNICYQSTVPYSLNKQNILDQNFIHSMLFLYRKKNSPYNFFCLCFTFGESENSMKSMFKSFFIYFYKPIWLITKRIFASCKTLLFDFF